MDIKKKAAQIIAATNIVTVASIDENGYPRPVAMIKIKDEDSSFYVSTGSSSAKTAHFKNNPKAGVSIVNGNDSITYIGRMEIITDEDIKQSLWNDWMQPHFPGGVNDPEYCVLKFTPLSTTYWIDNTFIKDGKYTYRFCQSCGMPMQTDDLLGTNKDGSANTEYCTYCYQNGNFVKECTMDEMIEHCTQFLDNFKNADNTKFTKNEIIEQMRSFFPHLKRWTK